MNAQFSYEHALEIISRIQRQCEVGIELAKNGDLTADYKAACEDVLQIIKDALVKCELQLELEDLVRAAYSIYGGRPDEGVIARIEELEKLLAK